MVDVVKSSFCSQLEAELAFSLREAKLVTFGL